MGEIEPFSAVGGDDFKASRPAALPSQRHRAALIAVKLSAFAEYAVGWWREYGP
jgi:hypothetical protein